MVQSLIILSYSDSIKNISKLSIINKKIIINSTQMKFYFNKIKQKISLYNKKYTIIY